MTLSIDPESFTHFFLEILNIRLCNTSFGITSSWAASRLHRDPWTFRCSDPSRLKVVVWALRSDSMLEVSTDFEGLLCCCCFTGSVWRFVCFSRYSQVNQSNLLEHSPDVGRSFSPDFRPNIWCYFLSLALRWSCSYWVFIIGFNILDRVLKFLLSAL